MSKHVCHHLFFMQYNVAKDHMNNWQKKYGGGGLSWIEVAVSCVFERNCMREVDEKQEISLLWPKHSSS